MNLRLSLSVLAFVVAALIAVLVSTSGGSTSKAQPSGAANASISVKQTPLGGALTDAQGHVLYLFAPDKPGVSTLSAAGRAVWPPFTAASRPAARDGAQASAIGSTAGASGATQVTYHGHPLYYFVGDRKPGQTAGQGLNEFGGRWYVVSGAGSAITAAPQTTTINGSPGGTPPPAYGY
jgi:predicted lipoprotein with Yx(FWY)xxD motif